MKHEGDIIFTDFFFFLFFGIELKNRFSVPTIVILQFYQANIEKALLFLYFIIHRNHNLYMMYKL